MKAQKVKAAAFKKPKNYWALIDANSDAVVDIFYSRDAAKARSIKDQFRVSKVLITEIK